jgi:general secretion pathway protein F
MRGGGFPLLLFSQQLAALLRSGVPLVECLETLAEREETPAAREVLAGLVAALRAGRSLSAALEAAPAAFPSLFVAMVRASEHTGDLAPTLARYVDYQSRLDAVARKVANACIYPAVLLGVGALVCLFLLAYVVPRFSAIYQERGGDLPLASRLMIDWGVFVQQNGWFLAAAGALAVAGLLSAAAHPAARSTALRLLLAWPVVAQRRHLYHLVRFYRTTGMLIGGGIPLVRALEMSAGVLTAERQAALRGATRSVREGKPVTAALHAHGLTSPVAMRLLAVGERSGKLGDMLHSAADFHEEELARWIDRFSRLFEPLLMAAIGMVIGAIVVMMYLPIFELAGSVR